MDVLTTRGANLREVQMDSSATKVECLLPRPRGLVPIHISSGALRVSLRTICGTPVAAIVESGAVQVGAALAVVLDGIAARKRP
jgi:hypothetical protein